jgi:hypothetical protein
MADNPEEPIVLVTVASEVEAVLIVNALGDYGVRARAVGGYTSGFKVGAPSEASVLVERDQLQKAKQALGEIELSRQRGGPECDPAETDRRTESEPPGQAIVQFALLGTLAGFLTSACETLASACLMGLMRWGPAIILSDLVHAYRQLVTGALVGALAGAVIGLIATRPGNNAWSEGFVAKADRQRLVWICIIAAILGGIGFWTRLTTVYRYVEKTESTNALVRAAHAEMESAVGAWWPLTWGRAGIALPASLGMVVGGVLTLLRRRLGRRLLLVALIAATAACATDLVFIAATCRAHIEIDVRYGVRILHEIQRRRHSESGKLPQEPPGLKTALYLDGASHDLRLAFQALLEIVYCLASIRCLREPGIRAILCPRAPAASCRC